MSQSNFCKVVKKKKRKYINDYQMIRKLGQGSFSKVYLCQSSKGEYYAIKQMNKPSLKRLKMPNGLYGYDMIKKELEVLRQLDHENIIWLEEVIDDPSQDSIYLVTEYHNKGSL